MGEIEYEIPGEKGYYNLSMLRYKNKCKKYNVSDLINQPLPVTAIISSGRLKRLRMVVVGNPGVKVYVNGSEKKGKKIDILLYPYDEVVFSLGEGGADYKIRYKI